jgi:hypothetical protein
MQIKKILEAGIAGGILLFAVMIFTGFVANAFVPYNIFDIPGMRPATDPITAFFYIYPFIISFVSAILFDFLNPVLTGGIGRRGAIFGTLLIILITIPNQFVIYTSMYYPAGFYLSSILNGLIGFPLFGMLCAWIFGVSSLEELKSEAGRI